MKIMLRVFFTRHTMRQKHYTDSLEHADFPSDVTPEAAYAELLTKHGSVLHGKEADCALFVGQRIKVAPDQFITISSHTVVDVDRKPVVLPSDRTFEQDLFTPEIARASLMYSPEMTMKRVRKQERRSK